MASSKINNEPLSTMSVEKLKLVSKSSPKYKNKVVKELQKRKLDPAKILCDNESV